MKAAIIIALVCVVVGVHGGLVLPLGSRQANHPVDNTPELSQILSYENDNIGIGPYNFEFETSDGQKREEHAQIVVENDEPSQIVDGSYSYVGTDGLTYAVNYHADKNGYVAIISKPHQ